MKNILVVGSINMDMVIGVDRLPQMGETLSGDGFMTVPGGKGANQAACAAKLGGEVVMLGAVGKDSFGNELKDYLGGCGVNVSHIKQTDINTGIAMITVYNGDNMIVLEKGANYSLSDADIRENWDLFEWADIVVLQLEIPWNVVMTAAKTAKEYGCTVVLNPAPVENFNAEILQFTDIIVPNEHEGGLILGKNIDSIDDAKELVREFADKGITAVVTLGENGCVYYDNPEVKHQPAIKTTVVDTTAAGDSFIGAMCIGMSENKSFSDSILFATKVASIVVSRKGAGSSLPSREEVALI